jgi:outer membrane protein assembly factor BamB
MILAGGLAVNTPVNLRAENWAHWRGPSFDGGTTEKNLPVSWSATDNVAWTTPMPGISGATPIIWGDHIFVSSPDAEKNLLLLCLNRKDGKVLWQKTVAPGDRTKGRSNMASPSPVTDGKRVIVIFGTGDLVAYDFSGKELWARNLTKDYGRFAYNFLYGSSPLLYEGKLFIQVLNRRPDPEYPNKASDGKPMGESYLLCLDPETGKSLWRQLRPNVARQESQEAYSSPIPKSLGNGKSEILVMGGDCTTAHDAATGEELWRCGGLNSRSDSSFRVVPSPVVAEGMIIACAPKREPVFGIRDGGKGVVTDKNIAWSFTEYTSDCVTPAYYDKKLFVLDGDKQMITCLDPLTGVKKWQGSLGTREIFRASPTAADGKIYCITENGTVVVVSTGDEFKILATIPMGGEPTRSAIAISEGQLFIRTAENLYCVGKTSLPMP